MALAVRAANVVDPSLFQTTLPGLGAAMACKRIVWTRVLLVSIIRGKQKSTSHRKVHPCFFGLANISVFGHMVVLLKFYTS